ncbi:DUF5937 family protein [Streptomyces noursei]|uniref:DUF5937 family protein n=1 Tax=Streptomyces noursei TaxID=1971 RepID=UPI0037FE9179
MSLTVDISTLAPGGVRFAPSPLAELTAMLHVLSKPGHHPPRQDWARSVRAGLDASLAARLSAADCLWRTTRADFLLPPVPAATLAEELDALDRLTDEKFVAGALCLADGADPTRPDGSPLTDPAARERARTLAQADGPRAAAFLDALLADPPAVRGRLRRLWEDCEGAFFAEHWQRVRPALAADARHKTELFRRFGLTGALPAVSACLSLDASGQRIVVDKIYDGTTSARDGLTFVPTAFGHPHVLVVHAAGWQPVVNYPVPEPGLPQPMPLDLTSRRLSALAHPTRLRLAHTLSRGPRTTLELAASWKLTAPEVSRHLAVLKRAGLLRTRRRGRYVLHELDLEATARIGTDLVETMLR